MQDSDLHAMIRYWARNYRPRRNSVHSIMKKCRTWTARWGFKRWYAHLKVGPNV